MMVDPLEPVEPETYIRTETPATPRRLGQASARAGVSPSDDFETTVPSIRPADFSSTTDTAIATPAVSRGRELLRFVWVGLIGVLLGATAVLGAVVAALAFG